MSDYGSDVLAWSVEQVGLWCRRAAGELVNDSALDCRTSPRRSSWWANRDATEFRATSARSSST